MISIDTLPDDVLLATFNSYLYEIEFIEERTEAWQSLVHVCRRWRSIVFRSPRHLDLRLVCTEGTRACDTLDIWPALPLIIQSYSAYYETGSVDNIIALFERSDRVSQIELEIPSSDLEIILAAMQQPFPELQHLFLDSLGATIRVIPDSFLGGSAPRLESLQLNRIPFPGLPKLLLSATHLVDLHITDIPHSGYISPDAIVAALFTLTCLSSLTLVFRSRRSCPDQASRRPPPSTRSVLPILGYFRFKGVSNYLEDLVACIDAPRLNTLWITFFNDIAFDAPQLMQFISRALTSRALEIAHITLWDDRANLRFTSQTSDDGRLSVNILCQGLGWQVSSLE